MRPAAVAFGALLSTLVASESRALCVYDGVDNAQTTITQEFRDSRLVVKARVIAAKDHYSDGDDDNWTLYRLDVQHVYKGRAPRELRFFTFRNSGGFYMDRPWVSLPAGHDIGGEYLLFLNSTPHAQGIPAAKGTFFVNYSCGVSAPWRDISKASREELQALEH